ncbi:TPA: hypothetical protein ACSW2P_005702, partial [Klebsiella variicola]
VCQFINIMILRIILEKTSTASISRTNFIKCNKHVGNYANADRARTAAAFSAMAGGRRRFSG